jgi:NitT/TauT family transport system substrate-binding protein
MKNRPNFFPAVSLAAAIGFALAATSANAIEISVSNYAVSPGSMPLAVALKKGYFQEAGADITAIRSAPGSAPAIREMIAGDLPYAEAGITGAIAAIKSGAQLKIVSTDVNTFAEVTWVTMPNSSIKTLADVKGKKIGFTSPKSATNMAVLLMLKKINVAQSDVTLIAAGSFPQALSALEAGGVDLVPIVEPNFSINGSKYRVVAKSSDFMPPTNNVLGLTTAKAAKEKPELIKGIIAARRKGLDFMLKNPAEASQILSPIFKTDAKVLEKVIIGLRDNGSTDGFPYWSQGSIDMVPLRNAVAGGLLTGELTETFDPAAIIDTSFLPDDLKPKK